MAGCMQDRGYLTATEWKTEWGGHKDKSRAPFKRLPFHCCAITFTPFEEPVCTDDGTIMVCARKRTFVATAQQGAADQHLGQDRAFLAWG